MCRGHRTLQSLQRNGVGSGSDPSPLTPRLFNTSKCEACSVPGGTIPNSVCEPSQLLLYAPPSRIRSNSAVAASRHSGDRAMATMLAMAQPTLQTAMNSSLAGESPRYPARTALRSSGARKRLKSLTSLGVKSCLLTFPRHRGQTLYRA